MEASLQDNKIEFHENRIAGFSQIEKNINICRLKNGNIAIGIRKGHNSIVYDTDIKGIRHIINILTSLTHNVDYTA